MTPSGKLMRLVAEFLPRLIELLGDIGRRRAVAQDHRGERQARSRKGLGAVIPAQFLHPLLQPFGDQLFHLLRRRPRPSRDDRHLLDREGRVFRPAQHQEGHDAGDGNRHEQEQGDGALAYGEGGEIESAHRSPAPLTATLRAVSLRASRTCSPSCSRCAPSATTRSPGLEIADDRSRFVAEAGDLHGTPGDPRRFAFDQPYAGTLARIENRADRYLQRRRGPAGRDLDGDGRAERRVCQSGPPARTEPRTSGSDGLRRPTTGEVSQGPSARFHTRSPGRWIRSPGAGFRGVR